MTNLEQDWLNTVSLQRSVARGCWEMAAGFRSHTHPVTYCLKGEVEEIHDGELMNVLPVNNLAVQMMMDDLWSGGVRPSKGVSSTGQAESMHGEIEHLRGIVTRIINAKWKEGNNEPT